METVTLYIASAVHYRIGWRAGLLEDFSKAVLKLRPEITNVLPIPNMVGCCRFGIIGVVVAVATECRERVIDRMVRDGILEYFPQANSRDGVRLKRAFISSPHPSTSEKPSDGK